MSLPTELLALKIKIANNEKKVSDLRYCLMVIDRDMAALIHNKTRLEQSVFILKDKNTVPIISEYKKIKEQLSRLRFEITQISTEKDSMFKGLIFAQEELRQINNIYDNLLKNDNNVITVKFGRKNG